MLCKSCNKEYIDIELTSDEICFNCSNPDFDEVQDYSGIVKEMVTEVINKLAGAKKVTPDKLKNDLVIDNILANTSKSKKTNSGNN